MNSFVFQRRIYSTRPSLLQFFVGKKLGTIWDLKIWVRTCITTVYHGPWMSCGYCNSTVGGEVSSSCTCRAIVMSMRSRFVCSSAATRPNSLRSTPSLRLQKSCPAHHLPTLCCTLSSKGSTSIPQHQIPLGMFSIKIVNDKHKK